MFGRHKSKEKSQYYLGEFEEIVLLAILRLTQDAYGVSIRREIEVETGRTTSIGAIYTTLERLEKKGYITSRQGEATAQRGGKAKRYFQIEGTGVEALRQAMIARTKLLKGVKAKRLRVPV